jgi:Helix-turn-helix domain of resolvase
MLVRNIADGKRTLLVARKKFVGLCRTRLRQRLTELEAGSVKIVTGQWQKHDLSDPRVVPLINYGISGVNRFQHCESVYCLTGYYISAAVLAQAVQDLDPTIDRFQITIDCRGDPRQRQARIHLPDDRQTILPDITQAMLEQKEADVVVQAVGRARPFTRPREVITFHTGPLPGVRYDVQFRSLTQARHFFGLLTPKKAEMASKAAQVRRLKAAGHSNTQIAKQLCVSRSTVIRCLNR